MTKLNFLSSSILLHRFYFDLVDIVKVKEYHFYRLSLFQNSVSFEKGFRKTVFGAGFSIKSKVAFSKLKFWKSLGLLMIGFLIKKNFFDHWDNFFKIVLINLGFITSIAFPVFIPPLLSSLPFLGAFAMLIGILWCFVYLSAAALSLKAVSDYGNFGFADFFGNLKLMWPAGLVMGAFVFISYLLATTVIPFYLSMNSLIGLMLAAIVFWTLIIAVLALQFFFAVRSRLDSRIIPALKKCFLIFFDNPMFCIFSFFHSLVVLIVSFLLALLAPGPAGILLFLDEALRLRLLKYDWLEANPDTPRSKIPWDALLIEEREKTGSRSLKNFIFPWKDWKLYNNMLYS